jgi:hypothetical protein
MFGQTNFLASKENHSHAPTKSHVKGLFRKTEFYDRTNISRPITNQSTTVTPTDKTTLNHRVPPQPHEHPMSSLHLDSLSDIRVGA